MPSSTQTTNPTCIHDLWGLGPPADRSTDMMAAIAASITRPTPSNPANLRAPASLGQLARPVEPRASAKSAKLEWDETRASAKSAKLEWSDAATGVFGNSTSLFLVALFAGATSPLGKVCKALRHKLADRDAWRDFELWRWPELAGLTGGSSMRAVALSSCRGAMVKLSLFDHVRAHPARVELIKH